MKQVWFLKGLQGQYEGQELVLPREVMWLGRAVVGTPNTSTHIFFEDGAVSRVHGALAWVDEYSAYVIHHRSQTNPTFLNDCTVGEPQLLKPGDIVSFGHQRLRLDYREVAVEEEAQAASPPLIHQAKLDLCFKSKGNTFVTQAPRTVVFSLDPSYTGAIEPEKDGDTTTCKVGARKSAELVITAGETPGTFRLVPDCHELTLTHRVTSTDKLILDVLYLTKSEVQFGPSDKITHQGLEIWPAGPEEKGTYRPSSENTFAIDRETFRRPLEENPQRGLIEFQTGPWRGTTILLSPDDDQGVEIGPGRSVAGYPLPLEDGPTCRVFFQDDTAMIEVVEAADGHYVSVNGELLFTIQAHQLISGSGIFLGKTMLHWTQPAIQRNLADYQLRVGDSVHPISRAMVRLGTAAQSEIQLDGSGIGPATGTLLYQDNGFYYKHLDGSVPGQLDGEVIISGDKVKLTVGSQLQLGLDTVITLEKK